MQNVKLSTLGALVQEMISDIATIKACEAYLDIGGSEICTLDMKTAVQNMKKTVLLIEIEIEKHSG